MLLKPVRPGEPDGATPAGRPPDRGPPDRAPHAPGPRRRATQDRDPLSPPPLDLENLRRALDIAGVGVWAFDIGTGQVLCSGAHDAIYGYPAGHPGPWTVASCLAHVLSEDRAAVAQAWTSALADGAPIRLLFRIRRACDGALRWIEATGTRTPTDEGPARILGTLADVTEREEGAGRQGMLAAEMRHRVKNILANVQYLAAQTGREAESVGAFLDTFGRRLSALAGAHALAAAPDGQRPTLAGLAAAALAPWRAGGRIVLHLPERRIGGRQALALSLALHELATNAAEHGALSAPEGRVALGASTGPSGALVLWWQESGGPATRGEALGSGFGTRLLLRALPAELGGSIALTAAPEGLRCEMRFTPADGAEPPTAG